MNATPSAPTERELLAYLQEDPDAGITWNAAAPDRQDIVVLRTLLPLASHHEIMDAIVAYLARYFALRQVKGGAEGLLHGVAPGAYTALASMQDYLARRIFRGKQYITYTFFFTGADAERIRTRVAEKVGRP